MTPGRSKVRERLARRYRQGLCIHCPARRDCKSSRCAGCREKARVSERRRQAARKVAA